MEQLQQKLTLYGLDGFRLRHDNMTPDLSRWLPAEIVAERAYAHRRVHCLFTRDHAGRLKFRASCWLLAVGGRIAVVSAAHSLVREHDEGFVLGIGDRFIEVAGESRYSAFDGAPERGKDPIDLEVILLHPTSASMIEPTATASVADFSAIDGTEQDGVFLVSGFPASKQRVIPKERLTLGTIHSLLLFADAERGVDGVPSTDAHLFLHYNQKQFLRNGNPVTSPSPEGMSGSPVWRILPALRIGDRRRLQLVGTLIEKHGRGVNLVVVTRVDLALMLLAGLNPALRDCLPSRLRGTL